MAELDLNSPEAKAAINEAVQEATKGLLAKRDELLGEVKKLRKGQEIDPADYQKLKDENDGLQEKVEHYEKAAKVSALEIEKERKLRESESGFVQKLLIDNGLNDALIKANVKPELLKAAKAMFSSQAQIKAEGDNRNALIGDKPITDFISEWSKSDEGKHFVVAPNNSGGNATGGSASGTPSKTVTRSEFDGLNAAQRMDFIKSGGTVNG